MLFRRRRQRAEWLETQRRWNAQMQDQRPTVLPPSVAERQASALERIAAALERANPEPWMPATDPQAMANRAQFDEWVREGMERVRAETPGS